MNNLERKRKIVKNINVILIIVMVLVILMIAGIMYLIGIGYDVNLKLTLIPMVLVILIILLILKLYKSKFAREYKTKYINKALKNEFTNFSYNPKGHLDENVLELLDWMPEKNFLSDYQKRVNVSDTLEGKVKSSYFKQVSLSVKEYRREENLIGKGYHTKVNVLFDGIVTEFNLNKSYNNILLETDDLSISYLKNKIKLESNKFNKIFKVSADDEQDAFLYLTPKVMEKIEYLYSEVISSTFFILISKDKLYLGQNYASGLFEPNIKEKIDEKYIIDDIKGTMSYVKEVMKEMGL